MANTIGNTTYREKYLKTTLEEALRDQLVAEAVMQVDRSDSYLIKNPYGSTPTVVVQPLSGTYAPANFTTTNDSLTVAEEFIVSEHVMDFEEVLTVKNLMESRLEEMIYRVGLAVDKYVLNVVLEAGTGTYTTPVGGFTTSSNVITIVANLVAKLAGYQTQFGMFLVVENTDIAGIAAMQMQSGFNYADQALNNGWIHRIGNVDIYAVQAGTFTNDTQGGQTWTNSGHRLFGVKGQATYAAPRGIRYEEKMVSGKTGRELVVYGYCGAKVWAPRAAQFVDITLA